MEILTVPKIENLINHAREAFPHQECATCECFLGYVTQLEMASDKPGRHLLEEYKPNRKEIHSCLGCDPCPPGDQYAKYLQENSRT